MDFTNAEKERITQLYGNDFQDITPDDAQLIGRWEAWKALNEAEYQTKMNILKAEAEQRLEQNQTRFEQSMENLNELHQMAVRRFEEL